jgi:hypothetical protein
MAHVSENNTPINVGRLLETATDPQRLSERFLRFVLTIVNAKDLVFFFLCVTTILNLLKEN